MNYGSPGLSDLRDWGEPKELPAARRPVKNRMGIREQEEARTRKSESGSSLIRGMNRDDPQGTRRLPGTDGTRGRRAARTGPVQGKEDALPATEHGYEGK